MTEKKLRDDNFILEVEKLSFGYDGTKLFDDVTFDVNYGDFAAIIGDNGVGKSTMIKLLLGILKPDSGAVRIYGENVVSMRSFPGVGYVPQNSGASVSDFPASVGEIVEMSVTDKKLRGKARKQAVAEALEGVGMASFSKRLISELSGGQQQRVMLARVLINHPKLLILDEPTVGIDGDSIDNLLAILHNQNIGNDVTILMVTHDLARVAPYVNRVLCISDHSLAESCLPETVVVHAHSKKHPCSGGHIHCAACHEDNNNG